MLVQLKLDISGILKTGLVASRITSVPDVCFVCHCPLWPSAQWNRLLCCCAGGICQVCGGAGGGTGILECLPAFEILSSSELLFLEISWPVRVFWWMVLSFPHYFLLCFTCWKAMSWFLWKKKQWFAVLQIQCLALVDLPLQLLCLG